MDIYRLYHEVSGGKGKHVIGKGMKNEPCNKVKKELPENFSSVLWKVEFVNDEIGYLTEEIFKQSTESELLVFCTTYTKT